MGLGPVKRRYMSSSGREPENGNGGPGPVKCRYMSYLGREPDNANGPGQPVRLWAGDEGGEGITRTVTITVIGFPAYLDV